MHSENGPGSGSSKQTFMYKKAIFVPAALMALVAGCAADTGEPSDETNVAPLSGTSMAGLRDMVRSDPHTRDLRAACPLNRSDALCTALREAEANPNSATLATARTAAASRVARGPRAEALSDEAVKYRLRERTHALTALHAVVGQRAPASEPTGFIDAVNRQLGAHYSLYPAQSFRLAQGYLPPSSTQARCHAEDEALLVFPGVIRLPSKTELESHGRAAIAAVDAQLGAVPLHFLGYSQGVNNALRTITSDPAIAARTRSVVSLNSAAHGSEAADTLLRALSLYQARPHAGCEELWPGARELCQQVAQRELSPVAGFLQAMLERMGAHFDDLAGRNAGEWLARHIDGLRSLTTGAADASWISNGSSLPKDVAYLTFRSVIADEKTSLPSSNWLAYQAISRTSSRAPWNDMQVRLVNQPLGGGVAPTETVMRVADGNHWQWALTSSDVPENLMPASMFSGIPRESLVVAQYEALAELGIVAGGER